MPALLRPYPSHVVFPDGLALSRGIDTAAEQGYAFVDSGLSGLSCADLEDEMRSLPLELDDRSVHPIHPGTKKQITQRLERCNVAVESGHTPMAAFVNDALALRIKEHRFRYPEIRNWKATEVGYQLYWDAKDHISAHRDRSDDELLGATITIHGCARVSIWAALGDPEDYTNLKKIDEHKAKTGSIMFLRAAGLNGGEQLIHSVAGPAAGRRLTLNFRMRSNILPPPSEITAK